MTLKLYVLIQSCHVSSYIVLEPIVPVSNDMRMVCLFKVVTPAWVINTVPFAIAIDYIYHSGSFEILQAKVKCHLSVGPASQVPYALNKHYFARAGLINVSFMYITQGCLVNLLGKFHDPRVNW